MPTMTEPLRLAPDPAAPPGPLGAERDDPSSFEAFFESEKAGLYSALCLVTRDRHEAEELTQDAFVRVLAAWDRAAIDDPTAYLYRTAMNAYRSRRRRAAVAMRRAIGADATTTTRTNGSNRWTRPSARWRRSAASNEPRSC